MKSCGSCKSGVFFIPAKRHRYVTQKIHVVQKIQFLQEKPAFAACSFFLWRERSDEPSAPPTLIFNHSNNAVTKNESCCKQQLYLNTYLYFSWMIVSSRCRRLCTTWRVLMENICFICKTNSRVCFQIWFHAARGFLFVAWSEHEHKQKSSPPWWSRFRAAGWEWLKTILLVCSVKAAE